ncbi:MAG: hypothetical protein LBV40_02050 [Methanomicrobiales archaeon]|nr:hypothetical protein [Methanomicrobiales archaeon]
MISAYLRRIQTEDGSCERMVFFCPICGYLHEYEHVGYFSMPCGFSGELVHKGPFIRRYDRLHIIGKQMATAREAGEPVPCSHRFADEAEAKQAVSDFWNGEGCLFDPHIREIVQYLMNPAQYPYTNRYL